MAISIGNLSTGKKLIDSSGNKFIIVARNHYGTKQSTVWAEKCVRNMVRELLLQK